MWGLIRQGEDNQSALKRMLNEAKAKKYSKLGFKTDIRNPRKSEFFFRAGELMEKVGNRNEAIRYYSIALLVPALAHPIDQETVDHITGTMDYESVEAYQQDIIGRIRNLGYTQSLPN